MPCNECQAPESTTNVYNNTLSAPAKANLTVSAGLTVTLPSLPVDGGIVMLMLDGVPQVEDTNYTVDELTGIITLIGAIAGQAVAVVYIEA